MNREEKAATIERLAADIEGAEAIYAVDYRGISVAEAAELRGRLRDADAKFTIVKNSLTERAADSVGVESLKAYLQGPTALTFVRGDAAVAAKALNDFARATQLLPFKGGLLGSEVLEPDQIRDIARLPARDVLYGQLVGMVASPVSGLVRTLGALVGGLAIALGQVRDKKESGEIPAGEPPAAAQAAVAEAEAEAEAPETAPTETETEAAPPGTEGTDTESSATDETEASAAPEKEAEPAATPAVAPDEAAEPESAASAPDSGAAAATTDDQTA